MDSTPNDKLLKATYKTYLEAFYMEIASENLIDRWSIVDELTKVLVALTASGSAISGWAMWDNPDLKFIWIAISGISSALAILHTALSVPGRIKHWSEIKRLFASLRIDLETFIHKMSINPEMSIEQISDEFEKYRSRYGEVMQRQLNDIFLTKSLEEKSQHMLAEQEPLFESSSGK